MAVIGAGTSGAFTFFINLILFSLGFSAFSFNSTAGFALATFLDALKLEWVEYFLSFFLNLYQRIWTIFFLFLEPMSWPWQYAYSLSSFQRTKTHIYKS